jgi:hypothetical protein
MKTLLATGTVSSVPHRQIFNRRYCLSSGQSRPSPLRSSLCRYLRWKAQLEAL